MLRQPCATGWISRQSTPLRPLGVGPSTAPVHGLPVDATILLCADEFEEGNGQLWLAQVFAELLGVHPSAALVLVGDNSSPYADAVRAVIASKAMGHRVRTIPTTSDAWIWYSMADVVISVSDIESLPRSMLEAMAFRRPVLAASTFGIPELITHGENGWLVPARDTTAIVAGIDQVFGLSEEARRAVGAVGRGLVEKSYRIDDYVRNFLDLIDEVERH